MPRYGLAPGLALDLTTNDDRGIPWDFTKKSHRDRAEALLDEQRPIIIIGSPVCTAFSQWQFLNDPKRPADIVAEEKRVGKMHVDWCMKLYARQMSRGGYFLHEHPAGATSWELQSVKELLYQEGVERIVADQCQHGQETEAGDPLKKPTGFMSNSPELLSSLNKRCLGKGGFCSRPMGGRQALCNGKVARLAAIYHQVMCEAILIGMKRQMIKDGTFVHGEAGPNIAMTDGDAEVNLCHAHVDVESAESILSPAFRSFGVSRSLGQENLPDVEATYTKSHCSARHFVDASVDRILSMANKGDRFVDDITGQPLPLELCRAGRRLEVDYFKSKSVWEIRTIAEALQRTGRRPISVRWVEVSKGDSANPKIRSRLVAREIRGPGQEACFAPTPPLESLRMVLSYAVSDIAGQTAKTWDPKSNERMQRQTIGLRIFI